MVHKGLKTRYAVREQEERALSPVATGRMPLVSVGLWTQIFLDPFECINTVFRNPDEGLREAGIHLPPSEAHRCLPHAQDTLETVFC